MESTGPRVVLTGASSGIGRATALAFAAKRARLVLAARNVAALSTVADEVRDLGGLAVVVPTDVSDKDHVRALADKAVEELGGVDVWVNNAGIAAYGRVTDISVEDIERVVQVNLLGTLYGTKAALDVMRGQGSGTIINVASALGRRAVPLLASYCSSKHGVLGFDEALRLELQETDPGIHLVDVLPSSINTPLFEHARSRVGLQPRPIPPVYEPRVVAEAIVGAAEHPVRTVYAGGAGRALDVAQRLSPRFVDWYLKGPGQAVAQQLTALPAQDEDNLEEPLPGRGRTAGVFGAESLHRSRYTRLLGVHPARAPLAVAGVLAGRAAIRRRRRHR